MRLSPSPSDHSKPHTCVVVSRTSVPFADALPSAAPPGTSLSTDFVDDYSITSNEFSVTSFNDLLDGAHDKFNEGYGINSIRTVRFPTLTSSDILLDPNHDPALFSSLPASATPIAACPISIDADPCPAPYHIHQNLVASATPTLLLDGPHTHLDDGAQASTTHDASHFHSYRLFTSNRPC